MFLVWLILDVEFMYEFGMIQASRNAKICGVASPCSLGHGRVGTMGSLQTTNLNAHALDTFRIFPAATTTASTLLLSTSTSLHVVVL